MGLWLLLKRWVKGRLHQLSGRNLLLSLLFYAVASWAILGAIGEDSLTHSLPNFIYWLLVTASTVGYGDLSPSSDAGKLVVALFVIPFGLGLFATCIGRLAAWVVHHWKRGLLGVRAVNIKNHLILVGWNGQRTLRLLRMLLREEEGRRRILLCVRESMQNPLPDEIDFVCVESYTNANDMQRASLDEASCIILDNPEDDITLAAALFCAGRNPKAHLLAYFNDESLGQLLKEHCPNVELVPSVAIEMLAKAAIDPGSSALHHELLNAHVGMTQYSALYPVGNPQTTVGPLFYGLKQRYDAILIGLDNEGDICINPGLDATVRPDTLIYYIADERIPMIDWSAFDV